MPEGHLTLHTVEYWKHGKGPQTRADDDTGERLSHATGAQTPLSPAE
jgi:hypothetical protein